MLFGEIVEPCTRALIEEDTNDYPEFIKLIPEWEGSSTIPSNLEALIFIETKKVNTFFHAFVLEDQNIYCKIKNAGIEVYCLDGRNYVIVFDEQKQFNTGEIIQLFEGWITKAKNIFAITSESICTYQNIRLHEKPESLIKMLSNDVYSFNYSKLECPNLISGLGANVLTYCIHLNLKCSLFVVYVDTSPLDSLNMRPLMNLVKKLNLPISKNDARINEISSNLYM